MPSLQLTLLYGLAAIGIIYVTATSGLNLTGRDIVRETTRSRCPFIRNSLMNGKVKIRSRGRIAKFMCNNGYELVGRRFATCVRGQWNNPVPICVTNGCPVAKIPANGQINIQMNDALVAFFCDSGYTLRGSNTVYCNGVNWNDTIPTCDIATTTPELTCDFEDPNICGWSHDRYHDFDWRRHRFSTPSGHVGTGPSYDHTLGKNNGGYYMYIEASAPSKEDDAARLFSPVYFPESTPGCFVFWYHMYGVATGSLRVYLKKETQVLKELPPVWQRRGQQGNLWLQGYLSIPELKENFQIVIEGIRGGSYVSDTAIDDVALYSTPCEDLVLANISRGSDSCQQRCDMDDEANSTCSCRQDCAEVLTCCDDYQYFCTGSAGKTDVGLFSIEPPSKGINISGESSPSPMETSPTIKVTTGQNFISSEPPISNAAETTLLTSSKESFVIANQTIPVTNSSSLSTTTTTSLLNNGTNPPLHSPTPNLTLLMAISTSPPSSPTGTKTSEFTNKLLPNSTANQTIIITPTKMTISETTQNNQSITMAQSESTKEIVIFPPSTKFSTAGSTRQPIKFTEFPSKTSIIETKETTAPTPKYIPRPSTFSTVKIPVSSIVPTTQTPSLTVVISTTKQLTPPNFSTFATSSKLPVSTPVTFKKQRTTYAPHSTTFFKWRTKNLITTQKIEAKTTTKTSTLTTNKFKSTDKMSTRFTTSMPYISTKITPMRRTQFHDFIFESTEKPNTTSSTVTTTTTRYTSPMKTTIKRTTPPRSFERNTPFRYLTRRPYLVSSTTISNLSKFANTVSTARSTTPIVTSTSQQLTTVICSRKGLNGSCIPQWPNRNSSQVTVVRSRTEEKIPSYTLAKRYSSTTIKTESEVTTSINTEAVTELYTSEASDTQTTLTKTQETSSILSETSVNDLNPSTNSYQSRETQDSMKPDYKLRTKYWAYLSKPTKKSSASITIIVAITLGTLSAVIFIVIVISYVCCRKRKIAQNKLSDDSEMRFLSDSEIVEFVDASSKLYSEPID